MIQRNTALVGFFILILIGSLFLYFGNRELPREQKITGEHAKQVGTGTVRFVQRPQPGGGGASGYQAECCTNVWWNNREYWCDCVVEEHGLIRIQPYTCCKNPWSLECFDFCKLAEYPEEQAPVAGVCPIERTCGPKCCKAGEMCRNGECLMPPEIEQYMPPPPPMEGPTLVAIPYTTYAFPWWYFILAAIILLILSYMLYRKAHEPKPPIEIMPVQKPQKRRKK